ncbi:MAG: type II toxin-antitoxin system Phd/YefM family antitoxin [Clostridiales bacterium]|nr:type II toxin-antitoxin system Phd/YefM family antitoxin [Clostridiales bacterium]
MFATNYSDARNNFKSLCDRITVDSETVIVTRKKKENIVMMSLEEYNNLMENMHIRKSENNYAHILEGIRQIEAGKVHEVQDLC